MLMGTGSHASSQGHELDDAGDCGELHMHSQFAEWDGQESSEVLSDNSRDTVPNTVFPTKYHKHLLRRYTSTFKATHLKQTSRSLPHLTYQNAKHESDEQASLSSHALDIPSSEVMSPQLVGRQIGPDGHRSGGGPPNSHQPGNPRVDPPGPRQGHGSSNNLPRPPIGIPEQPKHPEPKPNPAPSPPDNNNQNGGTKQNNPPAATTATAAAALGEGETNPQAQTISSSSSSASTSSKASISASPTQSTVSISTAASFPVSNGGSVATGVLTTSSATDTTDPSVGTGANLSSSGKNNLTGIAVGAVLGALVLVGVFLILIVRRRRKNHQRPASFVNFDGESWMRRFTDRQYAARSQREPSMAQSLTGSLVTPRVLHAGNGGGGYPVAGNQGQENLVSYDDPFNDRYIEGVATASSMLSLSTTPATLGHGRGHDSGSLHRQISRSEAPLPPIPLPIPVPITSLTTHNTEPQRPLSQTTDDGYLQPQRESVLDDVTLDTHDTHGGVPTVNIDDFPEPPPTPGAAPSSQQPRWKRNSLSTMRISWFGGGRKSSDMVMDHDSSSGHGHGELFDPARGIETLRLKGSDVARFRELHEPAKHPGSSA